jgi:hypothetical protein
MTRSVEDLALSTTGAAAFAARVRTVFEVRARPAPIIKSGSGKPRVSRSAGAATVVPAAIACIGFSLACCFSMSSQPWVLRLTNSETSDLMPCGETL